MGPPSPLRQVPPVPRPSLPDIPISILIHHPQEASFIATHVCFDVPLEEYYQLSPNIRVSKLFFQDISCPLFMPPVHANLSSPITLHVKARDQQAMERW
jgi:hypothetical protein